MWKLLEKIILALAMSIKSEPEYDGIIRIDGNDKVLSGFADVHFEDGTTFKFGIEDFVREYLQLRLMYHSNFSHPEMIPFIDKPFDFEVLLE